VTRARRLARAAPYAVLLAAAGYFYALAGRIEYVGPPEHLGPGFWPQAILAALALICAYEILKSLFLAGPRSASGVLQTLMEEAGDTLEGQPASAGPSAARVGLGVGVTLAYVVLIGVLGFFLCTAAYICAFILVGGYRRWGVALACGVLGSFAMLALFMKLVYVSLPLGIGPFQALSLALLGALGVR
jgi:putative tricarboxylic transport membrane protein